MRNIFLLILMIVSCSSPNKEIITVDDQMALIDSAIYVSQQRLVILDSTSKNTDSIITSKVKNTVDKMTALEQEIEGYKIERLQLVSSEKINYRVDTIYIETKKNFWGREKTSTTIKSDSVITMSIDSLTTTNDTIK
jgi:hypothetical protein